jgi:hypothetical protein
VVLAIVTGLYAAGLAWLYRLGSMPVPGRFLVREDLPAPSLVAAGNGAQR